MTCHLIYFLMENYGMPPLSAPLSLIAKRTILFFPLRFGRDNFQESMKIAHRMDHDKIHWNSFRFMVFDIPTSKGNYQERYQQLRTHSSHPLPPTATLHSCANQRLPLDRKLIAMYHWRHLHYVKEQIILRRYFRISWIKEEKESSCEILQHHLKSVGQEASSNTRYHILHPFIQAKRF